MTRSHLIIGLSILVLFAAVASNFSMEHGLSRLISIGEQSHYPLHPEIAKTNPHVAPGTSGYDSQFYIVLALDPSLSQPSLREYVDSPAYRARRIGMPFLSWLFGTGQAGAIIQIYSAINIIAWIVFAFLLKSYLNDLRRIEDVVRWSGCMFCGAIMDSVRLSLTDLPAMVLMFAALIQYQRSSIGIASAIFSAAIFIRETVVLALVAYIPKQLKLKQWVKCGLWSMAIILPYFLWLIYIDYKLPFHSGLSENFSLPFAEMILYVIAQCKEMFSGQISVHHIFGLTVVLSGLVQLGILIRYFKLNDLWWRVALPFGLIFILSGPNVWASNMAPLRIILPLTVIVLLKMPFNRWFFPLVILISLPSIYGLIRWIYNL